MTHAKNANQFAFHFHTKKIMDLIWFDWIIFMEIFKIVFIDVQMVMMRKGDKNILMR